jgi:hypothetical protein
MSTSITAMSTSITTMSTTITAMSTAITAMRIVYYTITATTTSSCNTRNIAVYFLYKWFSGFTLFNQEWAIPAIFVFLTRLKWSTGPNRAHCFFTRRF